MAADIFTKSFTNKDKWVHAHELVNIMLPRRLPALMQELNDSLTDQTPVQSRGGLTSSDLPDAAVSSVISSTPSNTEASPHALALYEGAMRQRKRRVCKG